MEGTVAQTQPLNERPHDKARFVYRGLTVPFMLLAFCFAARGSAANLTDVMAGCSGTSSSSRTRGRH